MVLSQASGNGWLACVPEPHNYSFCINVSSMQNWEPLMVIEMTPNAPALKIIYLKYYKHWSFILSATVGCRWLAHFDPKKYIFKAKIDNFLNF